MKTSLQGANGIRKLNCYLKEAIPFYARAKRQRKYDILIASPSGTNLEPYIDGIRETFEISNLYFYGLPNYMSLRID